MASKTTSRKYTYKSSGDDAAVSTTNVELVTDHTQLARLEDRIRQLQFDLETEREIRQRVDREKSDLAVQVMQMHERLEEAEAGVDGQIEINKKRDGELSKLRKLLEDVHLDSEENQHMLKKKHAEVVLDYQDQLDALAKSKGRLDKEKSKIQAELLEMMSQLESTNKERLLFQKSAQKLEVTVHELNIKIEEINRTVIDITTQKTRLSQENIELIKEVQELKVTIENVQYTKHQLETALNDTQRRLEDEDRRRATIEAQLHQLETEMDSVRQQLEEESEARLDLERQLVKAKTDAESWKAKYENEAAARAEEIEEIRRKFTLKIQEQEEHIESLMVKLSQVEKQKSRLQSEVEILIIDLEKANGTCRELQKRVDQVERMNADLKSKLDELGALYEASQRDNRAKAQEISRLNVENDKLKEQVANLNRDNKKLGDENHELKSALSELTRRFHELELEYKRMQNERDELATAYKEAEAARRAEEQRAMRLTAELADMRAQYEKRLQAKEEELEAVRKQMAMEIDQLNARLADAEARLKAEVLRIKKKMQMTITELEMSLDVANKNNIDLQKTVKKLSLQLQELQGHYDETQRQLQVTLDQYGIAQRRIQALTGENEELRGACDMAGRQKRAAEEACEEQRTRVNELTTINVNLSTAKTKLEQELANLTSDYDDCTKELRMSDERCQKAQTELKHTVDILHEEQERIVKIETIKKSLEVEVRNLTIRLEEVEASAIAGGKRAISKLEARIRDLEMEWDNEKRRHAETMNILRKKERNVKELVIQMEEDHKNIQLLQEALDKTTQKVNMYKRQLQEQEAVQQQNMNRVRRFQRDLETAEERAENAESNLSMVRNKHRSFVTQTVIPGGTATVMRESITMEQQQ